MAKAMAAGHSSLADVLTLQRTNDSMRDNVRLAMDRARYFPSMAHVFDILNSQLLRQNEAILRLSARLQVRPDEEDDA